MKIALCMIVKDEENRIRDCLDPLFDLLDEIVIVDTGSTDDTVDILRGDYGIEPLHDSLDVANCYSKSAARNRGYSEVKADWILNLDADERIEPHMLEHLLALKPSADIAGYLCEWNTYRGESITADYKLCIFRREMRASGFAHENTQVDLRRRGLNARWLPEVVVTHYPEVSKDPWKSDFYMQRLTCAIDRHPDWFRYHWFLGYTLYRQGELAYARDYLQQAAQSCATLFPVECLNASIVLATIQANEGEKAAALTTLTEALNFFDKVKSDFEVAINFRLEPWLREAIIHLQGDEPAGIKAYEFAY